MLKYNKRIIQKKAFTLAEVLITLGIIGVVAAMTIPTLVGNIQDKENRTAFKKAYTNFSQVIQQTAFDNGGSIEGQFGTTSNSFRTFLEPYFKKAKACDSGDTSCWTCNGARTEDYLFNGKAVTTAGMGHWYWTNSAISLPDGAIMLVDLMDKDCAGSDVGLDAPYNKICGDFLIDVNGCKPPNTWGRDIFLTYFLKDRAFPAGPSSGSAADLECNKSASWLPGYKCAEYVIQNKDY